MTAKNRFPVLILILILVSTFSAQAGDGDADQQAGMEAWLKAATPGPFHEFFAKKAGNWNIAGKMWMAPGAPPEESQSVAEAKMILGGRFLYETMDGESMGMPFQGLGITGYDNATGVVTSIWYDTMGTMTTILKGTCEKPGDPLELHGEMLDPMTGHDMKVRTLTTFISHDESLFEYFATPPGAEEMKVMELRYTRAE